MMGSWPLNGGADQDESDPSSLWINDPSAIAMDTNVTLASVPNTSNSNQAIAKPVQFETPGSSTLTEVPTAIYVANTHHNHQQWQQQPHQSENEGFFSRELNFLEYRFDVNGVKNGNSHSLKPESGEILNFGESKRSSYGGNGTFFFGHSQFVPKENKKRSPTSRSSNDEGMLSFTSGVIVPPFNMKSVVQMTLFFILCGLI